MRIGTKKHESVDKHSFVNIQAIGGTFDNNSQWHNSQLELPHRREQSLKKELGDFLNSYAHNTGQHGIKKSSSWAKIGKYIDINYEEFKLII